MFEWIFIVLQDRWLFDMSRQLPVVIQAALYFANLWSVRCRARVITNTCERLNLDWVGAKGNFSSLLTREQGHASLSTNEIEKDLA